MVKELPDGPELVIPLSHCLSYELEVSKEAYKRTRSRHGCSSGTVISTEGRRAPIIGSSWVGATANSSSSQPVLDNTEFDDMHRELKALRSAVDRSRTPPPNTRGSTAVLTSWSSTGGLPGPKSDGKGKRGRGKSKNGNDHETTRFATTRSTILSTRSPSVDFCPGTGRSFPRRPLQGKACYAFKVRRVSMATIAARNIAVQASCGTPDCFCLKSQVLV